MCPRENNIDHPDSLPIFEATASLHVPLYTRPKIPQQAVRDIYYSGFNEQVDLAFARSVLDGITKAGSNSSG